MDKKLLIFDLDGTLLNTVADLNQSLNYAFRKNGVPERSVEHTAHAIGNGISITIYRSLPEGASEELHDQALKDFRIHYRNHYLDNTLPYDGMLDTLVELKKRGYLLAVATNKLDEIAKDMISTLFPNIFDVVIGDLLSLPKKPDPTIIDMVINILGVERSNVTYIGDSEVDIESASNAQVDLILVNYGFHRTEEFLDYQEVKHIDKPNELLNLFK